MLLGAAAIVCSSLFYFLGCLSSFYFAISFVVWLSLCWATSLRTTCLTPSELVDEPLLEECTRFFDLRLAGSFSALKRASVTYSCSLDDVASAGKASLRVWCDCLILDSESILSISSRIWTSLSRSECRSTAACGDSKVMKFWTMLPKNELFDSSSGLSGDLGDSFGPLLSIMFRLAGF